jgi:hypothetical protein
MIALRVQDPAARHQEAYLSESLYYRIFSNDAKSFIRMAFRITVVVVKLRHSPIEIAWFIEGLG